MKTKQQHNPYYGEIRPYDFEGRRQPVPYFEPEMVERTYTKNDVAKNATGTIDPTTKTLLILGGVGIVLTGLLIWVLGRRNKA